MSKALTVPDGWLREFLVCGALFAFGLLLILPHFWDKAEWSTDGLFYEAQTREIRGEGRYDALHYVFAGELAQPIRAEERETPPSLRRLENPHWVDYSSQFYRRRWVVPAVAAAITPLVGIRSLEFVSLIGLALLGPLVYLLLRTRFSPLVSAASGAFCALLPPVLLLASAPRTDSLGLVLLIAALIAALRVDERGLQWLPLWVAVLLVLSFTRDETIVAIGATAWLAFSQRSRRMLVTTGVGIVAALPALILFAVPARENLAYVLNDYRIPTDTSWGGILSGYPGQLWSVARGDLNFPLETATPIWTFALGVVVVIGLAMLFASPNRGGSLPTLARGSIFGAVMTILVSVNYTQMRLELVFIPAVAVGVALLVEALFARVGARTGSGPPLPAASG